MWPRVPLRPDIDGRSYRQQVATDRAKQRGAKLPDDGVDPEGEPQE